VYRGRYRSELYACFQVFKNAVQPF
jgi:hypothetical protein